MKYQLHDYDIDSITLENDKIIFSFPKGFYVTDENGKELEPLRRKLVFTIDRGCCTDEPLESFISIRRRGRFGWKDISFKHFNSILNLRYIVLTILSNMELLRQTLLLFLFYPEQNMLDALLD